MIEIKEVLTKAMQKEFIEFPLKLYKGCEYYVPEFYIDQKALFKEDYVYYLENCEAVYYNAYKDGVMAGRISGILQKTSNEKTGERRIRFTRFDVIEDFEIAKALFDAVEQWGRSKGMNRICGPLGFSDLEREGMLIEGFDQPSALAEAYNYPYYPQFIEKLGFRKEVDWNESQIRRPKDYDGELDKMSDFVFKRYKLHWGTAKNSQEWLKKYADQLFDLLDRSYSGLYGTIPLSPRIRKMMLDNFKFIIDIKYCAVVLDENENVVLVGITLPSIADAVRKSGGRLNPISLFNIVRSVKNPKKIELCLIGVEPEWLNRGLSSTVAAALMKMLDNPKIQYADTLLNLEENYAIQNLWKRFDRFENKRRRAYVKEID